MNKDHIAEKMTLKEKIDQGILDDDTIEWMTLSSRHFGKSITTRIAIEEFLSNVKLRMLDSTDKPIFMTKKEAELENKLYSELDSKAFGVFGQNVYLKSITNENRN